MTGEPNLASRPSATLERDLPAAADGIRLWQPIELIHDGFAGGVAGRGGGISSGPFASLNLSVKTGDQEAIVRENRRRFLHALEADDYSVSFGRLEHGCNVAVFDDGSMGSDVPELFDGDAAVSSVPGLLLVMTFADCVPILLWDAERRVCGLAHAGWRGTALRVASATVRVMRDHFGCDPASVSALIGPSIGPCCYTVGAEVVSQFQDGYGEAASRLLDGGRLDLWESNRLDLQSAGVTSSSIEVTGICTSCRKDLFFSHRAEQGLTGRFGAAIGVRDTGSRAGQPQGVGV